MTGNTDTHTPLTLSPPGISDPPTACSLKKAYKHCANTASSFPLSWMLSVCTLERQDCSVTAGSSPLLWICGVRMHAATQTYAKANANKAEADVAPSWRWQAQTRRKGHGPYTLVVSCQQCHYKPQGFQCLLMYILMFMKLNFKLEFIDYTANGFYPDWI